MPDNSTATRLSICLRTNGFSFSHTRVEQGLTFLLDAGQTEMDLTLPLTGQVSRVKEFLVSHGIQPVVLETVRLVVPSRQFVWIPASLFDASRQREYLGLVADEDHTLSVYHSYSPVLDARGVFTAAADTVNAFKIALPGIEVHSQHSVLVNADAMQRGSVHPFLLLHIDEGRADIEAFYSGGLLLSNSYQTTTLDDAIYFAIDVMKKLHLETPDMELSACGQVDRAVFARVQRYFPNVTLYTGTPVVQPDPTTQPFPTYKYPLLF